MADSTILPGVRATLVSRDGTTSPEFYRFFRSLSVTASLPARVDDLTVRVEALERDHGSSGVTSVQGKQSIASSGIGVVQLRLVNDADTVDAVSFYGTDSAGVKGWNLLYDAFADTDNIFKINTDGIVSFDLTDLADSGTGALLATTFDAKGRKTGTKAATITGTAGRVAVANGDAVSGLPTIDLATLSDGGGGALLRIVRDAWGRLSGTSAATTSDLTEGSNLYFTTARVLATLLAGLSTATSAAITAADSVLSAFGKIQAQITALTSSLTGYVPTTRTITAGVGLSGGGDLSANRTVSMGTPSTLTGATANSASGTTHTHALTLTKSDVGLGNVDNTSDANKPVSTAQAAADALKLDKSIPAGYIDGLKMVWNSATSISATSGACYIQGSSAVISFPSLLTLSSLSLSASTWYHLYAYLNAGTPAIELVTTAPASPYSGTARSKTGDTSRRYLGSIRTDGSGNIYNFLHTAGTGLIFYRNQQDASPFRLLQNGQATTETSLSAATVVPATAYMMQARLFTSASTVSAAYFATSDDSAIGPPTSGIVGVGPNSSAYTLFPLNSSQQLTYWNQSAPGVSQGAFVDVYGYLFDR